MPGHYAGPEKEQGVIIPNLFGDELNQKAVGTATMELALHHEDHRHLLVDVPTARAGHVCLDALIVPTSRPVEVLRDALDLAKKLHCGLVVMCSGDVSAVEAAGAATKARVPVIAADVERLMSTLPEFSAAEMVQDTPFARPSDTSPKRNLALTLARVAGWTRVLFLDDDIFDVSPRGARAAAWLAGYYDAVGLRNRGFPDNSVVCHVNRALGELQAQFIGAGALAVTPQKTESHFPNIYNQDWFFIVGHGRLNVAATGRMWQAAYDPFLDPDRARREELGDCLAEGLYWLLDDGRSLEEADVSHWEDFLSRRSLFIQNLVRGVTESNWEMDRKRRMLESLHQAQETRELVEPELCVDYLQRWRADLETWRAFIRGQPTDLGVEKALEHLKWPGVVLSADPWPSDDAHGERDEDRLGYWDGWATTDEGPESRCTPHRPSESPQLA